MVRQDVRTPCQKVYDVVILNIFPPGNVQMHVVHLAALIVFGTMMVALPFCMNILVDGNYIYTETSVTHITSVNQNMEDNVGLWGAINGLLNFAASALLLLAIFEALSVVFDILHILWFLWLHIDSWWNACPNRERGDL